MLFLPSDQIVEQVAQNCQPALITDLITMLSPTLPPYHRGTRQRCGGLCHHHRTEPGDIIVNQDCGLLPGFGQGAPPSSKRTHLPDKNIDRLLFQRHLAQKQRRARGHRDVCASTAKEDD